MDHLLSVLPQMLRSAGDSDQAREQAVTAAWAAVVGPQIRRVTIPLKLERKTLIVATTDTTWRDQLRRVSGQTLFKLNSLLGLPVVTAIEFVVNEAAFESGSQQQRGEVEFSAPEIYASILKERVRSIPDLLVQEAFLRAAGKCLERRAT
jgi:predicted nucleic acid-binding Zn ribbon protein